MWLIFKDRVISEKRIPIHMGSTRLVKYLEVIGKENFANGKVIDIMDLNCELRKRTGKTRWSSNEIAGAMPKLRELYIPTGMKNEFDLNTYVVCNE